MNKATSRSDTRSAFVDLQGLGPRRSRTLPAQAEPERRPKARLALGFFVLEVLTAPLAVFVDTQSVRIVLLVLHRRVVAAFASATSQRDDDPVFLLGHGFYPFALSAPNRLIAAYACIVDW